RASWTSAAPPSAMATVEITALVPSVIPMTARTARRGLRDSARHAIRKGMPMAVENSMLPHRLRVAYARGDAVSGPGTHAQTHPTGSARRRSPGGTRPAVRADRRHPARLVPGQRPAVLDAGRVAPRRLAAASGRALISPER